MYFVTMPALVDEHIVVAVGSDFGTECIDFGTDAEAAIVFANSVHNSLDRYARKCEIIPFASAIGIFFVFL